MQRAGRFVAMAGTELAIAQRQLTVGAQVGIEYLDVAWAVHRLHGVVAILGRGREHVVLVVLPVTGLFPEGLVEDLRAAHFLVTVVAIHLAHVLLDFLPDRPALGVPEHQARRLVLHVEQVVLLAEAAVIALLGLFQHVQVGVQIFLLGPGGAVDALQLLVAVVTTPVGASHLHQLEDFELGGCRHVRAAAEVDEIALAVKRHLLTGRNGTDQLGLVFLALLQEKVDGLVTIPDFAADRDVLLRQFSHALLDGLKVFRGEGALVGEVVIEAVFDDRPDGHLCIRKQFLDRICQQVGRRMADDLETVGILVGDDGQISVAVDQIGGIDQFAVDLARQRRAGEAGADAGGHLGHGHRLLVGTDGTIRQFDIRHGWTLKNGRKKSAGRAALFI